MTTPSDFHPISVGYEKKPHEETWTVEETSDGQPYLRVEGQRHWAAEFLDDYPEPALSRAKLAAQAPAMAQILIDVLAELSQGRRTVEQDRIEGVLREAGVIP